LVTDRIDAVNRLTMIQEILTGCGRSLLAAAFVAQESLARRVYQQWAHQPTVA